MTASGVISQISDTLDKTGKSLILYHCKFPVVIRKGISTAEMGKCTVDKQIAAAIYCGNIPVCAFGIDPDPSHSGIDLDFCLYLQVVLTGPLIQSDGVINRRY